MSTLKFILKKIIIVEIMIIILRIAYTTFNLKINIMNTFLTTALKYLTPIAIIALILTILTDILDNKIISTALGIVLGGIILYYLYRFIL